MGPWDLNLDVQWRNAAAGAVGIDHVDHALELAGDLLDGLLAFVAAVRRPVSIRSHAAMAWPAWFGVIGKVLISVLRL